VTSSISDSVRINAQQLSIFCVSNQHLPERQRDVESIVAFRSLDEDIGIEN
jgi:hypothetical protein